jgi:phosphatidylinositol-3-phosphatase
LGKFFTSHSVVSHAYCGLKFTVLSILLALIMTGCNSGTNTPPPSGTTTPISRGANTTIPTTLPHFDHIVVAIEENHGYSAIIGSSRAPYINSLASQGALFTDSHGIRHPSEPNYLALFAGSTFGITDDSCPINVSGPDLGGELIARSNTFVGYSESLPSVGFTGCSAGGRLYARKHSPWVNFSDVPASANQPFTNFPTDYTRLPMVSFVVPNLQNDMHDGTIQQGDGWLKGHLDSYIQWAKTHNSLFILTWDEDDGSNTNQIATIFVGTHVKAGQYGETINHYSVLSTIEDIYGLPYTYNASQGMVIKDIWQ